MNHFPNFRSVSASSFVLGLRPALMGMVGLLGSALTHPAHAADAPQGVQVTQADANSVRVRAYSPDRTPIRVQVLHVNNGNYVLDEVHREAAYGTLLKFNTLPAGRYIVSLRVGPERYRYAVEVENKKTGANTIAMQELVPRRAQKAQATASL